MRDRALHAEAGTPVEGPSTPEDAGLPTAPPPRSGLAPTETVTHSVDAGPLSAVAYQRFADLPLHHAAGAAHGDGAPRVTATLTNGSERAWGYRVPRGPAPFAGGRATDGDDELRAVPVTDDAEADLFADGVIRPGESLRSTVRLSALRRPGADWPTGEYAFLQPLTVWTEGESYSYNWELTVTL